MRTSDAETYLTQYPRFKRWMNQCVGCQRKGYKPDMPQEEIHPNLLRLFSPLSLDGRGLCDQCSTAQSQS